MEIPRFNETALDKNWDVANILHGIWTASWTDTRW